MQANEAKNLAQQAGRDLFQAGVDDLAGCWSDELENADEFWAPIIEAIGETTARDAWTLGFAQAQRLEHGN